jgi:ATP-dependent HslUV protease subunit HslV
MKSHSTTIIGIIHKGETAIAGDGQVSWDDTILKAGATKLRTMRDGTIVAGFAGTAADGMALFELFEKKIDECDGNLPRASVELAKEWRTDKMLQKLEAVIVVADREHIFLISGNGDVVEPDDGIVAIGSGGPFALAAARGMLDANSKLSARKVVERSLEIAAGICVYTNNKISVEVIK